jgi:hypothetical protein
MKLLLILVVTLINNIMCIWSCFKITNTEKKDMYVKSQEYLIYERKDDDSIRRDHFTIFARSSKQICSKVVHLKFTVQTLSENLPDKDIYECWADSTDVNTGILKNSDIQTHIACHSLSSEYKFEVKISANNTELILKQKVKRRLKY